MTYLLVTWWTRKMYNQALSLTWHVNVGESPSGKGF